MPVACCLEEHVFVTLQVVSCLLSGTHIYYIVDNELMLGASCLDERVIVTRVCVCYLLSRTRGCFVTADGQPLWMTARGYVHIGPKTLLSPVTFTCVITVALRQCYQP